MIIMSSIFKNYKTNKSFISEGDIILVSIGILTTFSVIRTMSYLKINDFIIEEILIIITTFIFAFIYFWLNKINIIPTFK